MDKFPCLDFRRHAIDTRCRYAGSGAAGRRPEFKLHGSVTVATGLFDAIATAGGDPDELLRALGLKRSTFSSPDRFIASATFARLLEEAGRQPAIRASACTSERTSTCGTSAPSLTSC